MTGVQVKGGPELAAALDLAARRLEAEIPPETVGLKILHAVQAAAPKRTGYLARSQGVAIAGGAITVTAAAPYAVYVAARNPWAQRALAAETAALLDQLAAQVAEIETKGL